MTKMHGSAVACPLPVRNRPPCAPLPFRAVDLSWRLISKRLEQKLAHRTRADLAAQSRISANLAALATKAFVRFVFLYNNWTHMSSNQKEPEQSDTHITNRVQAKPNGTKKPMPFRYLQSLHFGT